MPDCGLDLPADYLKTYRVVLFLPPRLTCPLPLEDGKVTKGIRFFSWCEAGPPNHLEDTVVSGQ